MTATRRVIHHHALRERDKVRVLLETRKNFAGEKRAAIEREIKEREAGAANGRNLYRCEVCDAWGTWAPGWAAWGTIDEPEAYVCSDACRARHVPASKRRTGRGKGGGGR